MDAVDAVLLVLTGLNAVVWWCVWQRRPCRPPWHGVAWLRARLWWHLAGVYRAGWALVSRLHRWAQRWSLRVRCDTRLAVPCVLCGDARHTMQEHVRWPQAELEHRAHTPAGATATHSSKWATELPDKYDQVREGTRALQRAQAVCRRTATHISLGHSDVARSHELNCTRP